MQNKGFTMVEAMAAVVISVAVTSLILSFLLSSIKSFKVTESAIQAQNEAQFTMNMLMDNIMACTGIVEAKNQDNTIINISEALSEDKTYLLSSISFAKSIDSVQYIEKYVYYEDQNMIEYSLIEEGVLEPEIKGEFASHLDVSGFILKGLKGSAIKVTNYVNIELKFDFDGQKVSISNLARYRNGN